VSVSCFPEQYFLKEIQDYMLEIMQKVKSERITKSEFADLMNPAIDLLDDVGISIKDVELKNNIVWIYY